jgi:hypothetical protein
MSKDANAILQQGSSDSLAADSGYPVKVGGVYNTSLPSPSNGQRCDFQVDASGRLIVNSVTTGGAAAGANPSGNPVLIAGYDGTNVQDIATDTSGRAKVVGAAAAGTAIAGNPVQVGGSDGTNARALLQDQLGSVGIAGNAVYNNDNASTTACGISVVAATASTRPLATLEYAVNGAGNYDRWRNNLDLTLLASAARTAATASSDQTNYNGSRVMVFLNVTVASGTGGLTVQIQGKDPVSGNYVNLNANPTAVTGTGMTTYELALGDGAASGQVTQRTGGLLPRTWRVNVAVGDSSSYTYSLGASVIQS